MNWVDTATGRRSGDCALLHYRTGGSHLLVDVSIRSLITNTNYNTYMTRQLDMLEGAEQDKIASYRSLHDGPHDFIPFISNEHGRLGPRALALMDDWADKAVANAHHMTRAAPAERSRYRDYLIRRWRSCISHSIARTMMARSVINLADAAAAS